MTPQRSDLVLTTARGSLNGLGLVAKRQLVSNTFPPQLPPLFRIANVFYVPDYRTLRVTAANLFNPAPTSDFTGRITVTFWDPVLYAAGPNELANVPSVIDVAEFPVGPNNVCGNQYIWDTPIISPYFSVVLNAIDAGVSPIPTFEATLSVHNGYPAGAWCAGMMTENFYSTTVIGGNLWAANGGGLVVPVGTNTYELPWYSGQVQYAFGAAPAAQVNLTQVTDNATTKGYTWFISSVGAGPNNFYSGEFYMPPRRHRLFLVNTTAAPVTFFLTLTPKERFRNR